MIWFALGASSVALILSLVGIALVRKDRARRLAEAADLALAKEDLKNAIEALELLLDPDPTLDDLDRVSREQGDPEAA